MTQPLILDYKEYPIEKRGNRGKLGSKKPLIELSPKEFPNRKVWCLIDSGADSSISFKQIGEIYFGLKFSEKERIPNDVSGLHTCPDINCGQHPKKAPLYLKPIAFQVDGKNITLNVRWIDRGFDPKEDFLFILGRDFFEYFDIMFKQREQECWLYPIR